jgi:hypothetical protein
MSTRLLWPDDRLVQALCLTLVSNIDVCGMHGQGRLTKQSVAPKQVPPAFRPYPYESMDEYKQYREDDCQRDQDLQQCLGLRARHRGKILPWNDAGDGEVQDKFCTVSLLSGSGAVL